MIIYKLKFTTKYTNLQMPKIYTYLNQSKASNLAYKSSFFHFIPVKSNVISTMYQN